MTKKILLLLLLSGNAFANCNIEDILESMEYPQDINTTFELKKHLAQELGGSHYAPYLQRYLEDKNPAFLTDVELDVSNLLWAKQIKESGVLKKLKSAVTYVKVNPKSGIPDFEAKYLIGSELARLDEVFLRGDYIDDIKVVVTNDNVTTYWTHLDGAPVRGHADGVTWNSIPGAGAPDGETELVVSLSKNKDGKWVVPAGNHGSKNLVLHEFGHAFDKILGKRLTDKSFSQSDSFYRGWYNEYSSGNFKEGYYLQPENNYAAGLEESFAEGLAKYYGNTGNVTEYEWPYITNYFYNDLRKFLIDQYNWASHPE